MAIYAIGDIQGCYDEFRRLLDAIGFEPASDTLWLAGDLVNRGPKSLETLRFVKSLGESAVTVLGNHDLHLLATVTAARSLGRKDTLEPILAAPDRDELLHWLRHRSLFHGDASYCMLHAGLPPQWDLTAVKAMALFAEQAIQSDDYATVLKSMYGDEPRLWQEGLSDMEKIRFTINCLTRLRYCSASGELDFHFKGPVGSQPAHLLPWFSVPGRRSASMRIIFGHWSTLGFYHGHNVYGIDTGCLWGGQLTALELSSSPRRISIDCRRTLAPNVS
ncbi:symmetrical bis(5'-nucleosyl)-tetraphosphatase [Methylomonas rhizoryzae]|uniref:symmetrical bis(5'-nucleosyl)-tetraphosphatase n=1 Tax=Methylomonas rhizoryzae TaxID=2608981 RepID=UPI001232AC59|nr:symmetrical bis(5'-nucleosyl)-tetraphosphatase [Methylomonas rhizoryzae]